MVFTYAKNGANLCKKEHIMKLTKLMKAGIAGLFFTAASAVGVKVSAPYFLHYDRIEEAYNDTSILPPDTQVFLSETFGQHSSIGGMAAHLIQYHSREGDEDSLRDYVFVFLRNI